MGIIVAILNKKKMSFKKNKGKIVAKKLDQIVQQYLYIFKTKTNCFYNFNIKGTKLTKIFSKIMEKCEQNQSVIQGSQSNVHRVLNLELRVKGKNKKKSI